LSTEIIIVPDVGGGQVDVIEILVNVGDKIEKDDGIMTVESDKASMDIPSTVDGIVKAITIKEGDKISEGDTVAEIEIEIETVSKMVTPVTEKAEETSSSTKIASAPAKKAAAKPIATATQQSNFKDSVYAGPAVRRIAREFGIDLTQIQGTGEKNRISKGDVEQYVQQRLSNAGVSGLSVSAAPVIDFSKFGETETQPLSKINKLTGEFLHRNWVSIPHITQFDDADITDMEAFRQAQKVLGVKLTPIVFVMKAVVAAMKQYPRFNSSLDASGKNLIYKKYFNIGVAVDTPNGLVVPVIRDVDKKGLIELGDELRACSIKAREKGLSPTDMQGGCFSISSLGGIGGTAFTPIVNAPDVAILGLSKSQMKPVWNGKEFTPRLMLPLSLSYDHRVIDGADGARFVTFLSNALANAWQALL
jgi:pyruvate dehydrogenase E2 component (dihydrolipoamide acetyltransferase)